VACATRTGRHLKDFLPDEFGLEDYGLICSCFSTQDVVAPTGEGD
jgi:hypothetical protein